MGRNPSLQLQQPRHSECQLAAKREHRLKQLTKLLSRILAPHGSKPVRCLLSILSSHHGKVKVPGISWLL